MAFFYEFPHTRNYDGDLGWLIEIIKKMIIEINNQEQINQNLQNQITQLQNWVNDFDTSYVQELIAKYIAVMIFPEISDSGYVVYNIPESWANVIFNTTGLDIISEIQPEFGHLVLSY